MWEGRQSNENIRFQNSWLIHTDNLLFSVFSPPRMGESFHRFRTMELQLWRLTDKANNSYLWHKKNDFYFQLGFMKHILKSPLIATISLHRSPRDYSLSEISNFSIAFILSLLLYSEQTTKGKTSLTKLNTISFLTSSSSFPNII